MLKLITLAFILALCANNGINMKELNDPGCIQFTLENSPDSSWESAKLRLVGKNDFHSTYAPSSGETVKTQYCFNADTNKDGDVLIAGVYGLNSDNMGELSWYAKDAEGTVYKGSYMTFMTFMFHLQDGLYWTTLKESHNLEYSESSEQHEDNNQSDKINGESNALGAASTDYTESDALTPSVTSFREGREGSNATETATQLITTKTLLTDNSKTASSTSAINQNEEKWKLQGAISLCGYSEDMTKEQAQLVSSVIADTLNAASSEADVSSNDVSLLYWESTASPNEISDSTVSHKVIFIAYIYPTSFGYTSENINKDEEELGRHIESYIQASIDSGMFMTELEDLALGSHVGSFCGIKAASVSSKMIPNHIVGSYSNTSENEDLFSFSAEVLFYAIIASVVTIAALLVVIARRLVALKKASNAAKEPDVQVDETQQNSKYTCKNGETTDKERRFVKPAYHTTVVAPTHNIHEVMSMKKEVSPYIINFETTM